jgi:hypothetical protein
MTSSRIDVPSHLEFSAVSVVIELCGPSGSRGSISLRTQTTELLSYREGDSATGGKEPLYHAEVVAIGGNRQQRIATS